MNSRRFIRSPSAACTLYGPRHHVSRVEGRFGSFAGIVFTKGALWYNESFAKPNTIVRFDPKTETLQTWAIPGGGDIVRNMDVTPDGNPVTANSLVNQVGLVEIK